jgi:hypothetical protein
VHNIQLWLEIDGYRFPPMAVPMGTMLYDALDRALAIERERHELAMMAKAREIEELTLALQRSERTQRRPGLLRRLFRADRP